MNPEEKQVSSLGPGGYKCCCCGPAPKDRQKWRRLIRHRLKNHFRKQIHREIEEITDDR